MLEVEGSVVIPFQNPWISRCFPSIQILPGCILNSKTSTGISNKNITLLKNINNNTIIVKDIMHESDIDSNMSVTYSQPPSFFYMILFKLLHFH